MALFVVSSLMRVAKGEQYDSTDKSQTPVIFASFSGSFAKLHQILPLEKWECLRETRGGPASLFSLLFHMHRAAAEFNALEQDRGFRIAWAFVPDTRSVVCTCSQSLSPDAVISSLAYRQSASLPNPDEQGFTVFSWGGYLSHSDHLTAITLSLPPSDESNAGLEPKQVRELLTALDADYTRREAHGDLTVAFYPTLIPEDIREVWMSTVLSGLTPLMQKRDGESESGFEIRSGLARTELDAFHAFLFQVSSVTMVHQKEELTKKSSISIKLESIPGSPLARSLSNVLLPLSIVRSQDDSVLLDLALTLAIPESPMRSVSAGALCEFSKTVQGKSSEGLNANTLGQINQLASEFAAEPRFECLLRWRESQQQSQVMLRGSDFKTERLLQNLHDYLADIEVLNFKDELTQAQDLLFYDAVIANRRADETPQRLLLAANARSVLLSFVNGDGSMNEELIALTQFRTDYDSVHDIAGAGIAGSFRANQVLPAFCAMIDPQNANIYDRTNWKSPGNNDVAELVTLNDENSLTLTVKFEEDAYLWAFTTFMNLVELSRGVEYRVYSAAGM